MSPTLHILHLEDDPNDAALIHEVLKADGIACVTTRVEDRGGFEAALEQGGIDLVLSDFSLPTFDGISAIQIVRNKCPDIPVVLVSGTVGEEQAIDALKSGATDYVLKERMARLGPAVRRAMQDVADRTERRRLEIQIIESQKTEVIGQLAGGIAHDFNNILAVIMGCSDVMALRLGPESALKRYTDEISAAALRASGLTRQLLVFGRNETVPAVVLDLNTVVHDVDSMLRRLIDETIDLKIVPGAGLGHVKADAGYLSQVLMNLVVNARDAMPNGGSLTIATANTPTSVMLSVRDTGTGMTAEVRSRLFEAFFTTKAKHKGTGLGLAICNTIVQQLGGHIDVHSNVGHGTTFEVHLPRVDQPLQPAEQTASAGPLPRGTETLLVVEDEPSVRHLARDVLEGQGYTVLSASNGQNALHVARENAGSPIRLAVTDVIMPVMGGKVMAEWLRTAYPDIKILFTSGYTNDALARDGVDERDVDFLAKPYTPATLAGKVRELLDRPD